MHSYLPHKGARESSFPFGTQGGARAVTGLAASTHSPSEPQSTSLEGFGNERLTAVTF